MDEKLITTDSTVLTYGAIEDADPDCAECFGNGITWNGWTCLCCDEQPEQQNEADDKE